MNKRNWPCVYPFVSLAISIVFKAILFLCTADRPLRTQARFLARKSVQLSSFAY